ncbi:MAG: metal-sensitive transcriptional regulator [Caloramator sp.]|jgi:DNA-binding FrmR family transcriptional regulator|uniref:DNA-binding transcriptional regulator, FrmR family n=1 Tax=Caloramator proteoclasticus DSM 10124 TaxID=1121262 RepID=A0A1M4WR12_9CLOT|nr:MULTISPECIES: metal-sensitive transcriptional regulator [Caloramator]MBZ4662485.1 metal-sensitive transcriptional regulator [Caloramator sp.]SHE83666.1 DNA-binding transcriptional regulator, FrmR family [Caloramator proteoclasticus DSM 10124]
MSCTKEDLIKRLRRIEGQVKGIEKMVENNADCRDILVQVAAVRAAISKVGALILENYSKSCILKASDDFVSEQEIEDLIETIVKFIK